MCKKPYCVTIQMKATQQYFVSILFIRGQNRCYNSCFVLFLQVWTLERGSQGCPEVIRSFVENRTEQADCDNNLIYAIFC